MKFLLIVMLTFYFATFWLWFPIRNERNDNFAAGLPCVFAGIIAAVLTAIYTLLVLWLCRFV